MNRSRNHRIVEKIPVFKGLSPGQIQSVLGVCSERHFSRGQKVCGEGDESSEFFVILSGVLEVRSAAGVALAAIRKLGVVGEMGMLTGLPRSASVSASEDTTVLRIGKADLDRVIERDKDIGLNIYKNLAQILCERLRNSNAYLEQFYFTVEELSANSPQ